VRQRELVIRPVTRHSGLPPDGMCLPTNIVSCASVVPITQSLVCFLDFMFHLVEVEDQLLNKEYAV
jgi:hypothetical protein